MATTSHDSVAAEYLRDCARRGLRPATIRYYAMVIRRVAADCALAEPADLTLARVRAFQDAPSGLGAGSMRGYLRALKTYARWLADEGLVPVDPLARLKLPRTDSPIVTTPTDREVLALLRASGPLLRTVVAVLAGTGIRIGDLTILRPGDVRPGELAIPRTKNRAGRLVPLDPVLDALLARHKADAVHSGPRALFITRTGRPLTDDATRLVMADARTRAGLDLRVTPHVLRHWHARDLATHGTSERLLAARMGWRSHDLIARYAPVGDWEVARDVARYAPLGRLAQAGVLDGLFPPAVLRAAWVVESKNADDGAASAARRPTDARHS